MRLLVRNAIQLAQVDHSIVILDVAANQYGLITPKNPDRILRLLGGNEVEVSSEDIDLLERSGVCTSDPTAGRIHRPAPSRSSAIELPGCHINAVPKVSTNDRLVTGIAIGWATALLKLRSLEQVLAAAKRLRPREMPHGTMQNEAELADLYERHVRARTWFHSAPDRCLVNSLALLRYLASRGAFPSWTFGVKINPFAAHCWIEDERFLYGEEIAYCRSFVPILSV